MLAGRPRLVRLPPRVAELVEPTVLLIPEDARSEVPIGESRMGGLPDMPPTAVWPSSRGRPLTFVAQLDLAEVALHLSDSELPRTGMLYFFYDTGQQPWGHSPLDRDGFRVVYRAEQGRELRRRKAPAGLEAPYGIQALTLRADKSYPAPFSPAVAQLGLGARESEEYEGFLLELAESAPPGHHRLLGHVWAIGGGDPLTDCHLVASGVDLSDEAFDEDDPRIRLLSKGSAAWRPLFTLDARAAGKAAWGDWSVAYFFIRRSDLQGRDFDSVCMIAHGD